MKESVGCYLVQRRCERSTNLYGIKKCWNKFTSEQENWLFLWEGGKSIPNIRQQYICTSIDKITLPCCHSSTSLQNCTVADRQWKAGVRVPAKVDSKYGLVMPWRIPIISSALSKYSYNCQPLFDQILSVSSQVPCCGLNVVSSANSYVEIPPPEWWY